MSHKALDPTPPDTPPSPHAEPKATAVALELPPLLPSDGGQQQQQQQQQQQPSFDSDDARPSLLSCVLSFLDCALGIYVILTRDARPAYAFLSTTGGIIVSIALVLLPLVLVGRDSFWEKHAAKLGLVSTIKVMLLVSAFGLFLCVIAALRDSTWLDCVGLFITYAFRPTEPVVTAAATFSTNIKTFVWQTRLRKVGLCVGVWLGGCFTAITYAGGGSGSLEAVAALNATMCLAYIGAWAWIRRAMKVADYTAVEQGDPMNLFEAPAAIHQILVDKTMPTDPKVDFSRRKMLRDFIWYLVANGFAAHLAELLALSVIIAFTGYGRTGDSLLAVGLVQLVAVLMLLTVPFKPDKRWLMFGGRTAAGLILIAVGIAIPWVHGASMGVEEAELAWTVLFLAPYLQLTYDSDQPLVDVARLSVLRARIDDDIVRPARKWDFRKTMFHYTLVGQSTAELIAFILYAAAVPAGKWACLAAVVVVGLLLVSTTITSSRIEGWVLAATLRPTDSASAYAIDGISLSQACCCRRNGPGGGGNYTRPNERVEAKFEVGSDDDEGAKHKEDENGVNGSSAVVGEAGSVSKPPSPNSRKSNGNGHAGDEPDGSSDEQSNGAAGVAGAAAAAHDDPVSVDLSDGVRAAMNSAAADAVAAVAGPPPAVVIELKDQ